MKPHLFVADPNLPADHRGRRVCAACHLLGRPDDPRHAMPDVPEQAEYRRRAGEKGNDMEAIETIPLFDEPPRPVLKAAKTLAQAERDARPSWTKYTGKRVACDECVVYLHENRVTVPLPRSATRVRTVRATGEQLRLCKEHAEPRQRADQEAAEEKKASPQPMNRVGG